MNTLARSIAGMALTAGAVYLLDPVSGHRRRLLLRDQCARTARRVDLGTRDARHDVSERAHSLASRTKTAFTRDRVSDRAVSRHARDVLRHAAHPEWIALAVDDGHVILKGSVFPHEHQRLLDELRHVPGVRIVTDHLTDRGVAGDAYALEAGHKFRPAAAPGGWTVAGRVVAACAGCGLVAWGLHERKALGSFGASVGETLRRISKEEFDKASGAVHEVVEEAKKAWIDATDSAHEKVEEGVEWAESARDAAIDPYAPARRRSVDVASGTH